MDRTTDRPTHGGGRGTPSARLRRRARRGTFVLLAAVLGTLSLTSQASAALPLQTCSPVQSRATERHWLFGNKGVIDFGLTGSSTRDQSVGTVNSVEGTTVVTDTTGALQFWSNGQTVVNRDGDAMPNGTGLLGNPSATQTVAAFPSLGNPGIYFIVTTSANVSLGSLTYSVVDMSLDGGLGDVVTGKKNLPLGTAGTASEAITAVPNATGDGFWATTYTPDSPEILAYAFDGDGPTTGTAVVSTMPDDHRVGFGSISVSPDLSKVVLMDGQRTGGGAQTPARLRLLTIDAATGVFTQAAEWDTDPTTGQNGYYADFSPSGRYVYATRIFSTGALTRYDVSSGDATTIKGSESYVGAIGASGGAVRRGPDGRMYVANNGGSALSVVNEPEAADPADVDFVAGALPLPAGSSSSFGLAQTVTGCPRPEPAVTGTKTVTNVTRPGLAARPGDVLEYQVTYANAASGGPSDRFVITDAIPAGTTYLAGSLATVAGAPTPIGARTDAAGDDSAEYDAPGQRVVFRVGTGADQTTGGELKASQSAAVRFRVTVGGVVAGGTVSNTAKAAFHSPTLDEDYTESTPATTLAFEPVSDLRLTKTPSSTTPVAGTQLTYELTATNAGPSPSPSATIADQLPTGATYVSGDAGCSAVAQVVTCTVGALADGASATRRIVVQLAMTLSGPLANSATISGPNVDPVPGNSTGSSTVTVVPPAPPVITIGGPTPGTELPFQGTGTVDFGCTGAATPITCKATVELPDGTIVPIADGDPLPTTVPGVYTITVTSTDDLGQTTTEIRTYTVVPPAAPAVTVTSPPAETEIPVGGSGGVATFGCAGIATPITCGATLTLPDGTVAPLHDGDPLPTTVPGVYTITVTSVDRFGQVTVVTRTYVVVAPLSPMFAVPMPDRPIITSGRLTVTKSVNRTTLRPGQALRVQVRVTNSGTAPLHDVRVCERVPAGLRYVSGTPKPKLVNGQRCWTIKMLKPGQTAVRSYTARALNRPGRIAARTTTQATNAKARSSVAGVRILRAPARAGGVTG